jgi:hypothetical protein
VEYVIEEVYKDDTMLATTFIWEAIRTDRNKLKENERESDSEEVSNQKETKTCFRLDIIVVTLNSGQEEWSASLGSHSFEVHSCESFRIMV